MRRTPAAITFVALLAGAGCAARLGTAEPTPLPKSEPKSAPAAPAAPAKPVAIPKGDAEPARPVSAPPAVNPAPAPGRADSNAVPPATASAYVYAPQQAVAATAPLPRPPAAAPVPAAPAAPADSQADDKPAAEPKDQKPAPRGELQIVLAASQSAIRAGAIVTVDVMAASNTAVLDAPLHLSFDPKIVEFVDGVPGDFLTQGGSSVVFFADGNSRPGDVAVAAGRVERQQGASGAGLLCRVRFRGIAPGTTPVVVGQAKAWDVRGQEMGVNTAGTSVEIQ